MYKNSTIDSLFFTEKNSQCSRKDQCPPVNIEKHFYFNSAISNHGSYNLYRGIDRVQQKWVHIYARRADNVSSFMSLNKENARNLLSPKLLWAGEIQSPKVTYFFEVHERYGPSLKTMFQTIKRGPKPKQLIHLLLQMIKLVEKMNGLKLVCGQLDPQSIIFDSSPTRKQLFLLNTFKLKKKLSTQKPMKSKYCSRGAHLGRSLNTKDDLESICYILIDLFLKGGFLEGKKISEYEQIKLSGNIQALCQDLPSVIVEFYNYIVSLSLTEEINFFYWKTYLSRMISSEVLQQPYSFMYCKRQTTDINSQINKIAMQVALKSELQEEEEVQKEMRFSKISKFMNCLVGQKIGDFTLQVE